MLRIQDIWGKLLNALHRDKKQEEPEQQEIEENVPVEDDGTKKRLQSIINENGKKNAAPSTKTVDFVRPEEFHTKLEQKGKRKEITDREEVFSDEIVMDLLTEYSMEQIGAMLRVTNYMKDVNADTLRLMFKPETPAEDITAYIEMFYGKGEHE